MIRRAIEQDITTILELLIQVNMIHHLERPDLFNGPRTKYSREELLNIIKNDTTPVFVYVDEFNNVLGYAFCIFKQYTNDNIMTDIKTLYIDDLCVDEKSRGKQIGKKLLLFVEEFAKKNGCYNVTLNVWAKNTNALTFYKNNGMTPQKIGMEKIL